MQAPTFVTVVFEADVDLLQLQARSFDRHVSPDAVHEICVIDNSRSGLSPRTVATLRAAYGRFGDVVTIRPAGQVATVGAAAGWTSQQILKLAVADLVPTEHYVALDAKNFFIKPTSLDDFQDVDGRPRMGRHTYVDHPLYDSVIRTLDFLGVDSGSWIGRFPVTHTPFVFVTDEVRSLRTTLETQHRRDLAELFRAERLLEFPLYSAWLVARGRLDELYSSTVIQCPGVWSGARSTSLVRAVLDDAARREDVHLVAVHRRALGRMRLPAVRVLARFLVQSDLGRSTPTTFAWLCSIKTRVVLAVVRARLAERRRAPIEGD